MFLAVIYERDARVTIRYHENKVAMGSARLIHAENFLQGTNKLTTADKLERFRLLNTLNHTTKGNMLQAVLSFSQNDPMPDDKMVAISKRFSETMGLQDQPYLVYRHEDTRHAHMHFVTNIIKPDGKKIDIYIQIKQRKNEIRLQLEREFNVADKKEVMAEKQKTSAKRVNYGKEVMYEGMVRVLDRVMNEYRFTNLDEYDAILRGYNVSVQPIAHVRGSTRTGLMYRALDDNGNPIGKIVAASSLENKPTWTKLQGRFVANSREREAAFKDLSNRVKWVLFQEPNDRNELSEELKKERIHLQVIPGKRGTVDMSVLVDHHSKVAVRVADVERKEEMLKLIGKTTGLSVGREEQSLKIEHNHKIKRHG